MNLLAQTNNQEILDNLNKAVKNTPQGVGDTQNVPIGEMLRTVAPNISFDLGKSIGSAAGLVLIVAGILTFALLVFGGIEWIMAGGDKGKVEAAQKTITTAIIGLAVTASSFAIFRILQYFFGLNIVVQ